METLLRITKDHYSEVSHLYFKENINYLVNELDIYCEISNKEFINIVEEEKRYNSFKEDYKNVETITAKGYSPGEWQDYKIYYNKLDTPEKRSNFEDLIKQLERSFTHFNDYFCELIEYKEIEGNRFYSEEPYDSTTIVLDYIEFPDEEDVIKAYIEQFGKNFNELRYENN